MSLFSGVCLTISYANVGSEHLGINYQGIDYNEENETFGIATIYEGDCTDFTVEIYRACQLENLTVHHTPLKTYSPQSTSSSIITINSSDLALLDSEPNFFRILATEGSIICSDFYSHLIFYRFLRPGKTTLLWYCKGGIIILCSHNYWSTCTSIINIDTQVLWLTPSSVLVQFKYLFHKWDQTVNNFFLCGQDYQMELQKMTIVSA